MIDKGRWYKFKGARAPPALMSFARGDYLVVEDERQGEIPERLEGAEKYKKALWDILRET